MTAMAFDPTEFIDVPEGTEPPEGAPDLDAAELNKIGGGIRDVDLRVDTLDLRADAVEVRLDVAEDAIANGGGTGGGALGPGAVADVHVAANAAINLDKTVNSASRLAMTAAERTKLTGVAAGATANATDAQLRDRTTHTGSQSISTVAGLQTSLDSKQPSDPDLTGLAGLGDGVPVRSGGVWSAAAPDSFADTRTSISLTAVAGVITPNASAGSLFRHDAAANVTLADPTGGTNGQSIDVQVWAVGADRVLTVGGLTVTIPAGKPWWGRLSLDTVKGQWILDDGYGDGGGGGSAGVGGYTDEQVDDRVNTLIVAGSNITKVYNDAAGTLTLSASGGSGAVAAGDTTQQLGIAAYFYPTLPSTGADNYWDRTVKYGGTVGIMVMNPGDPGGPGVSTNSDYVTAIAKAQASGVKVLGYVSTRYAGTADSSPVPPRTTTAANADVDTWLSLYPSIDGIFFDEATADAGHQAYYQTVRDHVKATLPAGRQLVVINPGNATDESYMTACDIVMDYEGDPAGYRARTDPAWTRKYPANRFWHIVHTVTSLAELDEMIALTRAKRAGYVQFHDVGMPFPYGVLPGDPFWSHQVAEISRGKAQFPVDLAGAVTIGGDSGLSSLRFRGRKTTAGAPTTGTYAVGDTVLDSAGAWWECLTAGTPGTWTTATSGSGSTPADGSVTNAKVATGAAIDLAKTADSTASTGRLALTTAERTKLTGIATGANLYTDEQAQDASAILLTTATHSGLTANYDDAGAKIALTVTGGSATPTPHPTIPHAWSFGATTTTPATAPGAPTIGAVTPGSGQVSVSFTPPTSNGGAAISSYTATATPGGATATGVSSPLVVTGLTNGTSYTFRVKATNSAGTGAESATSASATPVASGAGTVTPGTSTPARWQINFGGAPHCRVTYETGVVTSQCQVVWVASMPDARARTTKLETGVAAQAQDAYQAYIQDLSTSATVADSGVVLGTASTWTATSFTPVAGRRYKGWARVRAADGQWSSYSGARFVAPTGVTRFFEDFGMVGDGTTRSGTDYGASITTGPLNAALAACNPGDVLMSNAPGAVLTASVSSTALTAGSSVFTSGMVGKKVMIYKAGKKDATGDTEVHRTTITAQTGTGATLAAPAPTAVTNAKVVVDYKEYWIGKIDVDQPTNMRGGVRIKGTGCLFFSNDVNNAGFRTANGVCDNTYEDIHFLSKNVTIRGSGQNNNTGPFFTEGATTMGHRFIGCYAEHARDAGFLVYGAAGGGPSDLHFVDVTSDHTMADPFHVTGTCTDIQWIRTRSVYCGDDGIANIGYRSDGDSARPQRIVWESPTMVGQDWGRGVSYGGSKDVLATDVSLDGGAMASFLVGSDGDQANTEHVQIRRFTVTNPKTKIGAHPTYSQGSGTSSTIVDDACIKLLNAASPTRQRDILIEDGTITNPGFAVQILSYVGGEFQDGTIIVRGVTLAGTVTSGAGWRDEATYPNHLDLRGIAVPAGSTPASAPTGANS